MRLGTASGSVWTEEEEVEVERCTIGMRTASSLTAAVMIALTVLVCVAVLTTSYDKALDDYRETNEQGLNTAIEAGTNSTAGLAELLMDVLRVTLEQEVATFFSSTENVIRSLVVLFQGVSNPWSLDSHIRYYFIATVNGSDTHGITEISLVDNVVDGRLFSAFFLELTGTTHIIERVPPGPITISAPTSDGHIPNTTCDMSFGFRGLCTIPFLPLLNEPILGPYQYSWTGLRSSGSALSISAKMWGPDTAWFVDIGLRASAIATFFHEIYIPDGSRVFAVEELHGVIGNILGVSHGPYLNVTGTGLAAVTLPLNVTSEGVDFVIKQSAEYMFEHGWAEVKTKIMMQNGTDEPVEYWLGVSSLSVGTARYWVGIALSRELVLGDLEEADESLKKTLESSTKRIDDNLKEDHAPLWGIVAAVSVVLMAAAFLLAHMSAVPLSKLQVQMASVAAMELEAVDDTQALSGFTEIHSMQTSFLLMVDKLREYRSYMPEGCLLVEEDEDAAAAGSKAPSGDVAIVFTDIEGSTALWESCGAAMGRALKLHNEVMRKNITAESGYEVKTIGDAFMVAFARPENAVSFALKTQEDLLTVEWPAEVLTVPSCTPQKTGGNLVWNGFRVRMGINYGATDAEVNPVTGRTDYFGHVVNTASRIEAAAVGGTIGISSGVHEQIGNGDARMFIVPQGNKALKGVAEEVPLWMVVPASVPARTQLSFKREKKAGQRAMSALSLSATFRKRKESMVKGKPLKDVLGSVATVNFCLEAISDGRSISRIVSSMLAVVDDVIDRTHGLVVFTCGNVVLLAWNVGRPCTQHVVSSVRCCTAFFNEMGGRSLQEAATWGMSTGLLLEGDVGEKRKFLTILGFSTILSREMAELAAKLQCMCLAAESATPCQASEGSLKKHMRYVGKWFVDDGSFVKIYEYRFLLSTRKWEFPPASPCEEDVTWPDTKVAMVNACASESYELIEALPHYSDCPVLVYSIQLLKEPVTIKEGINILSRNRKFSDGVSIYSLNSSGAQS